MYKKKTKCGRCGGSYYWEETLVDTGNCCSRCKKNKHDDDKDIYDSYGYGKGKDKKDGYGHDKWKDKKDDKHDKHDKHDDNEWIRDLLSGKFDGRKVTIFTKDGTHTVGTVDDVKKDFVKLVSTEVPCAPVNSGYYTYTKPVKVKSDQNQVLETFDKYFVRLDAIVGFGEPQDNGYSPCAGGGPGLMDDDDYMDVE